MKSYTPLTSESCRCQSFGDFFFCYVPNCTLDMSRQASTKLLCALRRRPMACARGLPYPPSRPVWQASDRRGRRRSVRARVSDGTEEGEWTGVMGGCRVDVAGGWYGSAPCVGVAASLWAFGALSPEFGDFLVVGINGYISLLSPHPIKLSNPPLLYPQSEAGRHHEVICPRHRLHPRLCRCDSSPDREARYRSGIRHLGLPAHRRLRSCLRKRRALCDHQGEAPPPPPAQQNHNN